MSIFKHSNYRDFIQDYRSALPNKGWGFVSRLADHLGVSQVQISQVLGGSKDFSLDQALQISDYLNLSETEKEYFIWLVIQAKSGSEKLSRFSSGKLRSLKTQATQVKNQIATEGILSEEQQNIFYSNYLYSAIRLYVSTEKGKTIAEISQHFQIPAQSLTKKIEFLVETALLQKHKDGRYTMGARRTFLPRESPNYLRNLINWRLRSLQSTSTLTEGEIMFTSPVSLSKADFEKIRLQFLEMIKDVSKTVGDSPAEIVACWNLDWFELKP